MPAATTAAGSRTNSRSLNSIPVMIHQGRIASATRWRATGAFHATASAAAISHSAMNGRCGAATSS